MLQADRKVLSPPEIGPDDSRVLFLAGPIQGADDWQAEAIQIIHDLDPSVVIANPRRDYIDGTFVYERQVDWEIEHLARALRTGAILFWCAVEDDHACDRAYAQTTRFELGEWTTRAFRAAATYDDEPRIALGIEPGFTGAKYLYHHLKRLPIRSTLADTCIEALWLYGYG